MANRLIITNEGVKIDDILINEKIFNQEMVNWSVVDRETQIDHLIDWIGEVAQESHELQEIVRFYLLCGSDRQSDKYLMKEDLTTLIKKGDNGANQTFFSSILTNEYVFWDEDKFDEICDEILKLNETL